MLRKTDNIHGIASGGGFVALLHHWSRQLRSSFNVSVLAVDNDPALTGTRANRNAQSFSGNLLYSPVPELTFGAEVMHAILGLEDDTSGSFTRLQFAAKYKFGYSAPVIKGGD